MAEERTAPGALIVNNPELIAYESFLQAIPEVDEDGYSSILLQLANASSIYDLDSPFNSECFGDWKDQLITITGARRAPSDFQDGLGVFLIVDFVDAETGQKHTATTGAVTIVAQIARMVTLGALPANVIPRVASKPTKKGYYPQHLEIAKVQPSTGKITGESYSKEEVAAAQEEHGF